MNEKQVFISLSPEDAKTIQELILDELTTRTNIVMEEDAEKAKRLVLLASELIRAIQYAENPIENVLSEKSVG